MPHSQLAGAQQQNHAVFTQQAHNWSRQLQTELGQHVNGVGEMMRTLGKEGGQQPQPPVTPPPSGDRGPGGSGRTETPPQSAVNDPLGSAGISANDAEMSEAESSSESPEPKSKGDDDLELAYPKSKFNRNYLGAHGRRHQLPEIKGGFSKNLYLLK